MQLVNWDFWGEQPEYVVYIGERSILGVIAFAVLHIESIATAYKWLVIPPVHVQAVRGHLLGLAVDGHTFIVSPRVLAENSVAEANFLIKTLNDLDGIFVYLSYWADGNLRVVQFVHKNVSGCLGPVEMLAEVVLGDDVLMCFKSKTHIYLIIKLQMSIQNKVEETRKSLDTLKYNFSNLRDSRTNTFNQFEHVLDAMAHVKSSCREITQRVMERKR